jgi:hypothetical protein
MLSVEQLNYPVMHVILIFGELFIFTATTLDLQVLNAHGNN